MWLYDAAPVRLAVLPFRAMSSGEGGQKEKEEKKKEEKKKKSPSSKTAVLPHHSHPPNTGLRSSPTRCLLGPCTLYLHHSCFCQCQSPPPPPPQGPILSFHFGVNPFIPPAPSFLPWFFWTLLVLLLAVLALVVCVTTNLI